MPHSEESFQFNSEFLTEESVVKHYLILLSSQSHTKETRAH